MKCPITYEKIKSNYKDAPLYSLKGLRLLDKKLNNLKEFSYNLTEQIIEINKATEMSISGQQPKLSIKLNVAKQQFEIVRMDGRYILKPQNSRWPQIPENEDLTMRLATCVDIKTPIHGLLRCKGGSFSYFIKRFDRKGSDRLPVEDFAQLQEKSSEDKYMSSLEKVAKTVEQYCTFPMIEKRELFKRVIFCYLTGNQDMHLKNFSLMTGSEIIKLSPGYDFLNTLLVSIDDEETALTLNGKKKNLTQHDFIDYYGMDRLGLTNKVIKNILSEFSTRQMAWKKLIKQSFLSDDLKKAYIKIIMDRAKKIGIS